MQGPVSRVSRVSRVTCQAATLSTGQDPECIIPKLKLSGILRQGCGQNYSCSLELTLLESVQGFLNFDLFVAGCRLYNQI